MRYGIEIEYILKKFSKTKYINNRQITFNFTLCFGNLNKNMKIMLEDLVNKKNIVGLVNKVEEFFEQFVKKLNEYGIRVSIISIDIRTNDSSVGEAFESALAFRVEDTKTGKEYDYIYISIR